MILFALPAHEPLAVALHDLAGLERGRFAVSRFANQELHAELETNPAGHACVVLGAVAPPDEHLLATLLLCHTLKKEGAGTVIALLPYLGYARHDKAEPRKSRATAWLGALLRASGVDEVVAVDAHSSLVHQLFPIPVRSLSPAELFARERCEAVRQAASIGRPVAHFAKERTREGIKHSVLHGAVSRRAILVDDILDTGGTLVAACEALRRAGAEEMVVMVTHGLFTGRAWERLWSLGVCRIYCTDTIPLPADLGAAPVVVLSVAPLLAGCFTPVTKDGEP